ncbi:TetR/AcrR family transcriptional regulator [Oceanobacillus sp. J11TS1]|uniref:TetR/AcrR family transcriptional regulator n=1 Tax=Oceanobacillus sp. J11TS1 TaxID=2807191 RepID=UPI001B1CB226|nr:TetR/AcrR family transcriptional regulator [Oceanobacillus sp. J11TS1]GIO21747.1 transcriptional regulator [Oceanobacillus sp. J11TS1]
MNNQKPKYHQIIEAAVKVISENGYHGSQVSKIAKEANVADGTIYLYFKNKEHILVSLFKVKMGEFINQIVKAIEGTEFASDQLYTLIETHFQQLSSDYHLAIVTQLELRQSNISLRLQINQVLKPYLTVIDGIVQKGIAQHQFREDLNIPLVRQMIFGTLDEIVTNWVMKEQKYDLNKLVPEIHKMLVSALATER